MTRLSKLGIPLKYTLTTELHTQSKDSHVRYVGCNYFRIDGSFNLWKLLYNI